MIRAAPAFDPEFRDRLRDLLTWRRDVRRFRRAPLPAGAVERLLALAALERDGIRFDHIRRV